MRIITSFFTILLASILGIIAISCNDKSNAPMKVNVNRDLVVAIYSTADIDGAIEPVTPCLLEETVHISELLLYPNDKGITMPFVLSDTIKYAKITEGNLNKRIAIFINGQVVSTPVVKMKLDNGRCSVMLDDTQFTTLFPNINIQELQANNH